MFAESRFNIFIKWEDDSVVGFNTSTAATISLTRESYDLFKRSVEKNTLHKLPLLWQSELLHLGFIIPAEMDELQAMQAVSTYSQNNTHGLGLTICPTLDCNLACTYCYQGLDKSDSGMPIDIMRLIPRFVEDHMPAGSVLQVHLYGGEPLMERDIMFELTERLFAKARSMDSDFRLTLVTNGTLIDQEVIDFLSKHHLEGVQITLDGPKEIHDERKPLLNSNQSCYDTIMNNITGIDFGQVRLAIRMNIDDINFGAIPDLLAILKSDLPNATVVPAPVVSGVSICKDAAEHCIDNEKFAKLELGLMQKIWEHGLQGGARGFIPRMYFCGAKSVRSYTIDPQGYLYKCWNFPGHPEEAVGHLATPLNVARSAKWLNPTPYHDSQCSKCKFLPQCQGGCPYQMLVNQNRVCDRRKFYLKQILGRRIQEAEILNQESQGGAIS